MMHGRDAEVVMHVYLQLCIQNLFPICSRMSSFWSYGLECEKCDCRKFQPIPSQMSAFKFWQVHSPRPISVLQWKSCNLSSTPPPLFWHNPAKGGALQNSTSNNYDAKPRICSFWQLKASPEKGTALGRFFSSLRECVFIEAGMQKRWPIMMHWERREMVHHALHPNPPIPPSLTPKPPWYPLH